MKVDIEKLIMKALETGATVTIWDDHVFIAPDEEPKQAPEKPKKAQDPKRQGAKKTLDMGKVKALRNAGWSLEAIAEEMGVSGQTIANRLKEE